MAVTVVTDRTSAIPLRRPWADVPLTPRSSPLSKRAPRVKILLGFDTTTLPEEPGKSLESIRREPIGWTYDAAPLGPGQLGGDARRSEAGLAEGEGNAPGAPTSPRRMSSPGRSRSRRSRGTAGRRRVARARAAGRRGHRRSRQRPRQGCRAAAAERFIQILRNEWAYARPYRSSAERPHQLPRWLYRHNARWPHGGIGGAVPASRLQTTFAGTTASPAASRCGSRRATR